MKKEGIKSYYQAKIEECEIVMNEKSQDLRRLEAQRNALNAKGKEQQDCFFFLKAVDSFLFLTYLSPSFKRRTSIVTRTWILCWRSCQSDGQKEGPGQGKRSRTTFVYSKLTWFNRFTLKENL